MSDGIVIPPAKPWDQWRWLANFRLPRPVPLGRKKPADDLDHYARIRCPRCMWQPRAGDEWQCSCGQVWNTFDTRGICPACGYRWRDTQCLYCNEWSKHDDWYMED